MGNMGGVYNRDAIQRIIHIQKLEQILGFLNELKKKFADSMEIVNESEASPTNSTFIESGIFELVDACIPVLEDHLKKIMESPYFLRELMRELKDKKRATTDNFKKWPDLARIMERAGAFIKDAILAVKNIEFLQYQFSWEKRKLLEKLKEQILSIIELNYQGF